MIRRFYILAFVLVLFSCNQPEEAKTKAELSYFDLNGYFGGEITRLKNAKTKVNKTVQINGVDETKTMLIDDWNKELAIFANADINKTSWKGSFKVNRNDSVETYTSNSKKIPVKKISVMHKNADISKIEIIIDNKNILFESHDTLIYVPKLFYKMTKQQKIRLLAPKNYTVMARFNP